MLQVVLRVKMQLLVAEPFDVVLNPEACLMV